MASSSWGILLHLAANSLFVYCLWLVLFPPRHQATEEEASWGMNRSTGAISATETQDPVGAPLGQQRQLQKQSCHPDVRSMSTAAAQAAPTTERRPPLYRERPIMELRLRAFIREVRHQPTLLPPRPRGFRNPWNLCYRNAIVVALLHSRRFVAFLHVHARRSSDRAGGAASALLARFHALAVAYWEAGGGGGGGGSGDDDDRCETMHALLWRACNESRVDGPVLGGAAGAGEEANGPPGQRACPSWQAVCREQQMQLQAHEVPVVGGSNDESNNTPLWLWEQQQDAVAFWDWLVETARAQLLATLPRGRDRRARAAADWFGAMFDVRLTTQWVDQQQGATAMTAAATTTTTTTTTMTTRQVGLKVRVGAEEAGGRTETLDSLLAALFLEDVPVHGEGGWDDVHGCPTRCCHSKGCRDNGPPPPSRPGGGGPPPHQRRQLRRRLLAAPELLPVHLMRVGSDAQGRPVVKHQTAVDVPERLDVSRWLAPHVFAAGSRVVYRLSTVVSHRGRDAQSGHYVAHVRYGDGGGDGRGGDGRGWARVDDQKVTLGVPFRQITNVQATGENAATGDDRFDPVLLVYEKWTEQYAGGTAAVPAGGRRRHWREDDASAHADGPAAKKPRSGCGHKIA